MRNKDRFYLYKDRLAEKALAEIHSTPQSGWENLGRKYQNRRNNSVDTAFVSFFLAGGFSFLSIALTHSMGVKNFVEALYLKVFDMGYPLPVLEVNQLPSALAIAAGLNVVLGAYSVHRGIKYSIANKQMRNLRGE